MLEGPRQPSDYATELEGGIDHIVTADRIGVEDRQTMQAEIKTLIADKNLREEKDNVVFAAFVKLDGVTPVAIQTSFVRDSMYKDPRVNRKRVGLKDTLRGIFTDRPEITQELYGEVFGVIGTIYSGEEIGQETGEFYLELTRQYHENTTRPNAGFVPGSLGSMLVSPAMRLDYYIPLKAINGASVRSVKRVS